MQWKSCAGTLLQCWNKWRREKEGLKDVRDRDRDRNRQTDSSEEKTKDLNLPMHRGVSTGTDMISLTLVSIQVARLGC